VKLWAVARLWDLLYRKWTGDYGPTLTIEAHYSLRSLPTYEIPVVRELRRGVAPAMDPSCPHHSFFAETSRIADRHAFGGLPRMRLGY
jgi:hypothetical protein